MDFYDAIAERGFGELLQRVDYEPPDYLGWEKCKNFMLDIILNNKSVYIAGDYDVDGLMCVLELIGGFKYFGVKNIGIYKYRERTHNVDPVAITQCIQGHYEYFIIADAGSNDYGLLKRLTNRGVKVIILDHHNTGMSYDDYDENFAVINTTIENRYEDLYRYSAGALCYTVIDLLARELGKDTPVELSALATISLFSDVMDMSNPRNRAIYYLAINLLENELPPAAKYFLTDYNKFNARYIGFWYAPKINACFRTEQFDPINGLFLEDLPVMERTACVKQMTYIWSSARKMTDIVSDIIIVNQWDNFVLADLSSVDKYINITLNKLWNFTGLVANQLSEKYGKTSVVFCPYDNRFKGSVRDLYSRNYLPIFKQLCFAEGHNSAFGIKLNPLDYDSFISGLRLVDQQFAIQGIDNEPIVVDWPYQTPDIALFNDIARFNEFSGSGVPQVLIRKQVIGSFREVFSKYDFKYDWDGVECTSTTKLQFGQYVLLKPFYSWKLKLQAQSK